MVVQRTRGTDVHHRVDRLVDTVHGPRQSPANAIAAVTLPRPETNSRVPSGT